MATLSSSSTDQEVWDEYDTTASYEEDASVAFAKRFVTACRILLRRRPTQISVGGQSTEFDARSISDALEASREWIAANNTSANGGSVRHLSFRNLRD
jgi:hypothetical protein